MEQDFRALIVGDPAIVALIAQRVYPSTYAQAKTDPAVRYQKISGSTGLHMRGSSGLSGATMQVDVRARTAAEVLAVRDALVTKLHGFRGDSGQTDFQLIALESDRGIQFDKTDSREYYTASLDFEVHSRAR